MNLGTGIFAATLIFILAVWSIVWKGFALWISAKENKKRWFIALLVLNTVGILEIIYIFFFSVSGKTYISKLKRRYSSKKTAKTNTEIQNEDEEIV